MNKLILIPIIILYSCSTKSSIVENSNDINVNNHYTNQWSLKKMDSIIIPVNNETNVARYVQLVNDNNEEYILSPQEKKDSYNFHVYSLKNKSFYKTISFRKEGSNGIGRVSVVTSFNGFGEFLLTGLNNNRFYIVDSSGNINKKIDLNKKINGVAYSQPSYPTFLKNNKLYFYSTNSDYSLNHRKYTQETKPEVVYNIQNGMVTNDFPSFPTYPNGYEKTFEYWKVARCFGPNDEFVYSFPYEKNIFVQTNGEFKEFEIPNTEINTHSVSGLDLSNLEQQMDFISSVGLYTYLFFDHYRDLFYRVFLLPGETKDLDGNLIMIGERPFRIEIINSRFELVGKVDFRSREYNPYCLLISKEGLLLSRINPHFPQVENKFIFQKFEIIKL